VPDYGHPYLPAPSYRSTTGALNNPGYYGNGQPTPPVPIPRSNWFGVAGGPLADRVLTDTHIATARFEHDFNNNLKISNATRYISVDRSAMVTSPRSLGDAASSTTVNSSGDTVIAPVPSGYPVNLMTIAGSTS